jgi:chromate reductase
MKQVLFIPGSLREASSSRATVRALVTRLEEDVTCRVADPGLLPHYNADIGHDPAVESFHRGGRSGVHGVVFVTPEYNYSIPGVLKNAIDWASRPAYNSVFKDKPCFIISVSGGALGGVRAQAHLKYVMNGMLARPFACQEIVIPQANAKIADGNLADETILEFAERNLRAFVSSF